MSTHLEVRLGSLVAAAGLIWAVKVATLGFAGIAAFGWTRLPAGPLELCAVGILVWLHAQWRKSVQVH